MKRNFLRLIAGLLLAVSLAGCAAPADGGKNDGEAQPPQSPEASQTVNTPAPGASQSAGTQTHHPDPHHSDGHHD